MSAFNCLRCRSRVRSQNDLAQSNLEFCLCPSCDLLRHGGYQPLRDPVYWANAATERRRKEIKRLREAARMRGVLAGGEAAIAYRTRQMRVWYQRFRG